MKAYKKTSQILNAVGILLVFFVLVVLIPLSLPKLAGIRVFGVLSGSMEPEYATGGVVYVQDCNAEKLQVGDVITYRLGSNTDDVMTHRIVEIDFDNRTFFTKGDANDAIDPEPVKWERVIGRVVFYLPYLAIFAMGLGKPIGVAILGLIFFAAILCWIFAERLKTKELKTKEEKKPKKDILRPALRLIAVLLILGAGTYLTTIFWGYHKGNQEYTQLAEQVFGEETFILSEKKENELYNSMAVLMQKNADMIGWITFENADMELSYPVMQGEDNQYYLNHTFSGEENSAGSIFMDIINHDSWEDAHTIIYGHNMKNLSMFGKLRNYKTKDFYEGNEFFWIYTENASYRYQIFAYYDVSEYSDVYTVWYTPDENFEAMIEKMQRRSYYDTGVEVGVEDKILTLSTCSTEGNRFVLHAKRQKSE